MVLGRGVRVFVAQRLSTANAMHTQGITYRGCSDDLYKTVLVFAEPEIQPGGGDDEGEDERVEDEVGSAPHAEGVRRGLWDPRVENGRDREGRQQQRRDARAGSHSHPVPVSERPHQQ